jgi:hypothetical protein
MLPPPIESEIVSISLDGFPQPPVDLDAVACRIGVADVVRTECRAGFTTFDRTGPTIRVSSSAPHTKYRFILAHELAHVMLRLPRVMRLVYARGSLALSLDEERLADRIAATLLIPESWVEAMRESWMTLEDVLHFAGQADVAPEMLIRRMAASQIDIGMMRWRPSRRTWAVVDRPGVPSSLHGCVRLTFAGHWSLENVEEEESNLVIDCYVNDKHMSIVGKGVRSNGGDVLQLVQPSQSVLVAENTTVEWFKNQIDAALGSSNLGRQLSQGSSLGLHGSLTRAAGCLRV